ncbi:hypothetical protein [Anaerococcus provencensis]|uniref:hypothetical protein n=1 Tax=Anaerococcus provencensis TaxID=938293 RepID=UPI0002E338CB|nr:hypothetical protein [Anaerococcus provencensis]
MKILQRILKQSLIFAILIAISACQNNSAETEKPAKIYLYGEEHGTEADTDKEFSLWKDYYDNQGMRNLFLEVPNFVAGYLNRWMDEDDDQILEILRDQYKYAQGNKLKHYGTLLRSIKKECPETVFYGTDISDFNDSLGQGYLKLLDKNKDKTEIDRVKEVMDQGDRRDAYIKEYKENQEDTRLARIADYREQMLVENFIYEFDQLKDKRIMGIYGAYHVTNPEKIQMGEAEIMADQLKSHYGDIVSTKILAQME